MERPRTISMGRLDLLDKCPHSLYLDLRYDRGPQSHAMARGAAFHDMAEKATDQMLETGEPYYPGEVARDLVMSICAESDLVVPAHEQDVCRLMAFNWGEHHSATIDLDSLVANERLLMVKIGGWTLRGRVDRAHVRGDDCWIYDYKTGLHIPSSETLLADFQLRFYSLLLAEGITVTREGEVVDDKPPAAGANRFWPSLVFPRHVNDESNECVTRAPMKEGALVPFKREDFHDFKAAIAASLKALERGLDEGEWPASPGSHCSRCPAQAKCPIPMELHNLELIETEADATRAAESYSRLESERKRLYEGFKAWAKENDAPVPVGDEEWDFRVSYSMNPRDRKELKRMQEQGIAIPADFYVSTASTRFAKKKRQEVSK